MEKTNETKIVKYIFYYLKGFTYLMPVIFFAGYVGTLIQFIKNGKLSNPRLSLLGVSFIRVPGEIIFGPKSDALIVFAFALIMFLLFMSVFLFGLKFVKNIVNEKLLVEQNGKLLKIIGVIIIGFAVANAFCELFLNLGALSDQDKVWMFSKVFMLLVPVLSVVLLHPIFVLGLFFVLLGEILIRASIVKQENDLTV